MSSSMKNIAVEAKEASKKLALLSSEQKDRALLAMAGALTAAEAKVLAANRLDVDAAKKKGTAPALVARLALDTGKIRKIAEAVESVARLADPVGRLLDRKSVV